MKHILYILSVGAALLFHTACSQVELNEQVGENPYGEFAFQYSWGANTGSDMYVFLDRVINARHYVTSVDAEGKPLNGQAEDSPAEAGSAMPQEGEFTGNKFQARPGEYIAVTVSKPGSTDGYSIPYTEKFQNDATFSLNSLYVEVQEIDKNGIPELEEDDTQADAGVKWTDKNSGYPFISKLETPIYYSRVDNLNIQSATSQTVGFKPVTLTQTLHIPFRLTVEEGVTIKKIVAELSGVVRKVVMFSGAVETENTYRVIFTPTPDAKDPALYDASVNVLGVLGSTSPALTAGPGILQLAFYAECEGRKRTFVSTKNLYNSLKKAQPMKYDEKTGTYSIARTNVTLDAGGYSFFIKKDDVYTENIGGSDEWDQSKEEIKGEL